MHAFILAGGFATRLWPLTESRPKPLLPVAGKPILTHLVEQIPAGMPITVSTNAAFAEAFHKWKIEMRNAKCEIQILIEDTRADDHKLGALGAVAQWIADAAIDEDVLLLTGDNYIGCSMSAFIGSYREGTTLLAAHDIGDRERAKQFGTVIAQQISKPANQQTNIPVHSFEEKPENPKSTLVSTGCSILPRTVLPILVEFAKSHPDNVGGIFEELRRRNLPVEAFVFSEAWFDIGSFESYLAATRSIVGEHVIAGEGSTREGGSTRGSVVMGKGCRLRNANVENVVLFDGCTLQDCDVSDCICDDGCIIRGIDLRGKMLRRNTHLAREN